MNFPDDQIAELKLLFPSVSLAEENGHTYFFFEKMRLPSGCDPAITDGLLCATPRDGYPSRLFFHDKITSRSALNWNSLGVRILERNWNAYSWKINRDGLRLAQMMTEHLGALR